MNKSLLVASEIKKNFNKSGKELSILKGVSFDFEKGCDYCIVGASGAGKSTFLQILGTLDRPSSGDIFFKGESLGGMSDEQLAQFRSKNMGFVFQFHHLLPEFSALENIMMASCISGQSKKEARVRARRLLEEFGLLDRADHFPTEMSGGEQQRVAIARAIVNEPKILFADEPTGNLDTANSQSVQELFFELQRDRGITLVVVTHDRSYASKFSKCVEMADGQLVNLAADVGF